MELDGDKPLMAVGDVTVRNLMARGYVPDVAVVDLKTQRDSEYDRGPTPPEEALQLKAVNPAGRLTHELWTTLLEAQDHPRPVWVMVEGEEDLATLTLMATAPLGAQIAYGQPHRGMVIMELNDAFRAKAYELLALMEEH